MPRVSKLEERLRNLIPQNFGSLESNAKDLTGTPDLVFRDVNLAVFVHGCFWHRHDSCQLALWPQKDFVKWLKIFNSNVKRDIDALHRLHQIGWYSLVVWECEINDDIQDVVLRIGITIDSMRKQ